MVKTAKRLLTVREAARRIGVHEHTIRNWEKRGLIRLVHLPGSNVRRAPVEEVERIVNDMQTARPKMGVRIVKPDLSPERRKAAKEAASRIKEAIAASYQGPGLEADVATLRGRSMFSETSAEKAEDIWVGYDPEKVIEALAKTAGSWSDIDADALVASIYRAREEGSRPATRP